MKLNLCTLLIFISLIIFLTTKQGYSQTFQTVIGGELKDNAHDAVFLDNGCILVTGAYYTDGGFEMDAFTAKLHADGEVEWQTCFGFPFEDGGSQIAVGEDGNYFIAGHSDVKGTGVCDAYYFCLNPEGDTLWTRRSGIETDDAAFGCSVSHEDGFISVGRIEINSDPQGFVTKYSSTGEFLWMKTYGIAGDDYFYEIVQSNDGGYFICGRRIVNGPDFWLLKVDSEGNELWSKNYGAESVEIAHALALASDGGVLIAGASTDYTSFSKIWIIRTDENGNEIWSYSGTENENDASFGVVLSNEGNWIISGTAYNLLNHSNDAVVMELNDNGILNWIKYYGSSNNDSGECVDIDESGNILLAGRINYSDNDDMLILKTDQWGDVYSSIQDAELLPQIDPFPNPCENEVIFQLDHVEGTMQFAIFDMTGREVYELNEIHTERILVNTNSFLPGIYFYKLTDIAGKSNSTSGRLVVL